MDDNAPIGRRRANAAPQANPDYLASLRTIPTALLSDNMQGLVGTGVLRPYHRGSRMAGTAMTVRVRAGDNLVLHRALDHVRAGDVLVVDAGGEVMQAVTGKIMLRYLELLEARRDRDQWRGSRHRRNRRARFPLLCPRHNLSWTV